LAPGETWRPQRSPHRGYRGKIVREIELEIAIRGL